MTHEKQAVGVAGTQQQGFEPGVRSDEAPAYAEPAMSTIEVMEVEVLSGPGDHLDADEGEFSLVPEDSLLEDEE